MKRRMRAGYEYSTISVGKPTNFFPPIYPVFLGVIYKTFGRNFYLVQFIQAMLDSLAAALVFRLGFRLFGLTGGLISGLLYAFYPWSLENTRLLLTEALYIPLTVIVFYYIQCAIDRNRKWPAAAAGFFTALAYETRFIGIILLPLALLGFVVHRTPRLLTKSAMLLLFFAMPLIPWAIRNKMVFDKWMFQPTKNGHNLCSIPLTYIDNPKVSKIGKLFHLYGEIRRRELLEEPDVASMNEMQRYDLLLNRGREFIKANPGYCVSLAIHQVGRFFKLHWNEWGYGPTFFVSYYLMYFGVIIGFVGNLKSIRRLIVLVGYLFLYPIAIGFSSYSFARMRWPLNPVLSLFAAAGILVLIELTNECRKRLKHETKITEQ